MSETRTSKYGLQVVIDCSEFINFSINCRNCQFMVTLPFNPMTVH